MGCIVLSDPLPNISDICVSLSCANLACFFFASFFASPAATVPKATLAAVPAPGGKTNGAIFAAILAILPNKLTHPGPFR